MLEKAKRIAELLHRTGGQPYFVGGFVRDELRAQICGIKTEHKDIDIEVFGMSFQQISDTLTPHFRVDAVGQSFGVLKIDQEIDVSVPRRESKVGTGHRGFDVQPDPTMSLDEAAARRDFTINSAMRHAVNGQLYDPFDGLGDIKKRVLRMTSDAFMEDPLRVLRGMQFAARFCMVLDGVTAVKCRRMADEFHTLAKERIFEEWWKLVTKGVRIDLGLRVLEQTGWDQFWPIFPEMQKTPQDPIWHPEGDVLLHAGWVAVAAAEIAEREKLNEEQRAVLVFAALCHDFGKTTTTKRSEEGRWVAPGHADEGVKPTLEFLTSIGAPTFLLEQVPPLVAEHMVHIGVDPTPRIIRRLANRLGKTTLKMWSHIVESDYSGRPPLKAGNPVSGWVEMAETLQVVSNKPAPILMGRHLIEKGWKPGIEMGVALKAAFEAQLDGTITDLESALAFVEKKNHDSNPWGAVHISKLKGVL